MALGDNLGIHDEDNRAQMRPRGAEAVDGDSVGRSTSKTTSLVCYSSSDTHKFITLPSLLSLSLDTGIPCCTSHRSATCDGKRTRLG